MSHNAVRVFRVFLDAISWEDAVRALACWDNSPGFAMHSGLLLALSCVRYTRLSVTRDRERRTWKHSRGCVHTCRLVTGSTVESQTYRGGHFELRSLFSFRAYPVERWPGRLRGNVLRRFIKRQGRLERAPKCPCSDTFCRWTLANTCARASGGACAGRCGVVEVRSDMARASRNLEFGNGSKPDHCRSLSLRMLDAAGHRRIGQYSGR